MCKLHVQSLQTSTRDTALAFAGNDFLSKSQFVPGFLRELESVQDPVLSPLVRFALAQSPPA